MRVLITGASGMLGSDVAASARAAGHQVTAYSHAELDISDAAAVRAAVREAAPVAIVNCAAWTDVDGAEADESAAHAVNADGAAHVAAAAADGGATVVHVSTYYVFDGFATRPYVESDATGPASAYGRSKLAGEHALRMSGATHLIARTAWLFGLGGRNFAATMLALAGDGREEVAVVTDQLGCPTYTGHVALALLECLERGITGTAHLAAAGHCSWKEFAEAIFAQAQVSCRVVPASSAEMARPAPRPPWSVLASERPEVPRLAPWTEGLAAYLSARRAAAPPAVAR
jgi:dTDP-4-dehydrorhamnose reductase